MTESRSIATYLGLRLLVLMMVALAGYVAIAKKAYFWGMDETTEYYLFADGERALNRYLPGEVIGEHQPGFREYFWAEQLPQNYQDTFAAHLNKVDELQVAELPDKVVYFAGLGNEPGKGPPILYVVHVMPHSSEGDAWHTVIRQELLAFAVVTLVVFSLLVGWFVYRLAHTMLDLSRWAARLGNDNADNTELPASTAYFTEVAQVAQKLGASYRQMAQLNEREQMFLRCLSHELRTPVAVTTAALDIIDKKVDDPTTLKFTGKIRRASNTMRAMTETILWLWREPDGDVANQQVVLSDVVAQAIEDHQYLCQHKPVELQSAVEPDVVVSANPSLLAIVCNNLVRNACQYCDEGKVLVEWQEAQLLVCNPCDDAADSDTMPHIGFGLGLLIVQRIIERQGWHMQVLHEQGIFAVRVDFGQLVQPVR